jgi:sugar phosphate isomerase/epimerase
MEVTEATSVVPLCFNLVQFSPRYGGGADLELLVESAAEAGFQRIGADLDLIGSFEAGGRSLADLARVLDRSGVRLFELIPLPCTDDVGETAKQAEAVARVAAELGPEFVIVGGMSPPATMTRSFERCCEIVARAGSRVALEFVPYFPVATLQDALGLTRSVGDMAAVLVDVWHFERGPNDWSELDEILLSEIAYVHFDDALPLISDDLANEARNRRVMPGEGELDLTRFARTLRDRGYDGVVSIEVLSEDLRGLSPLEYARLAWSTSSPYWS